MALTRTTIDQTTAGGVGVSWFVVGDSDSVAQSELSLNTQSFTSVVDAAKVGAAVAEMRNAATTPARRAFIGDGLFLETTRLLEPSSCSSVTAKSKIDPRRL